MKMHRRLGLAWLLLSAPAFAAQSASSLTNVPSFGDSSTGSIEMFLRVIGALMLVTALLLGGAWAFKKSRWFPLYQAGPAQLRILESKPMGQRNNLIVVAYMHHRFLVAVSATGINLLCPLPDEPEGSAPSGGPTFAEKLDATLQKGPKA